LSGGGLDICAALITGPSRQHFKNNPVGGGILTAW